MSLRPIRRILIANRGEIARRIIRTCARLGIDTVAVYAEPDRHAPFVREATSSFGLGSPDSYLSIPKIILAAQETGADAIHPGYGFLSENPGFAEACERAAITLVGPSSATMRALGSKTAAKSLAASATVPTAPSLIFSGDPLLPLADQLATFASRVGYPVILKAAAGGGGRGMRIITPQSDLSAEIESAQREALKAFGSSEIFAERCISPARHIEVQIAADRNGGVVALGTRDCSLQRNNQKIIEEGPATALASGVTEQLCEAACRLAREARYVNLGTVEFLYSPDGSFYFLEVNTRLQVEHPVTELVTGLDLVELQIRLAEGTSLPELKLSPPPKACGHAIEARLCAEEYLGSFVMSTGIVEEFEIPTREMSGAVVRVDSGVEVCSEVSHHYDSLIAKVIVHAPSRSEALAALKEVLSRSRVSGVKTNRGLLIHLLSHPTFASLAHTIQGSAELFPSDEHRAEEIRRAHALGATLRCMTPLSPWAGSSPWLSSSAIAFPWSTQTGTVQIRSETFLTETGASIVMKCGDNECAMTVSLNDLYTAHPDGVQVRARINNGAEIVKACIRRHPPLTWVHLREGTICLEERARPSSSAHGTSAHAGREIVAHIPGKVAATQAVEGQHVVAGQVILVLDSMKMEHPIKSPVAGTLTSLPAPTGSIVQSGSLLAVIEDD